jgi:hypothetical protein
MNRYILDPDRLTLLTRNLLHHEAVDDESIDSRSQSYSQ